MREWLADPKARDQYVTRFSDESEILWNDTPESKDVDRELCVGVNVCVSII